MRRFGCAGLLLDSFVVWAALWLAVIAVIIVLGVAASVANNFETRPAGTVAYAVMRGLFEDLFCIGIPLAVGIAVAVRRIAHRPLIR